MLRSNPVSSMQKTYDEVYLICSTAIYFEQQNNENEAVRSWREALDQIYYHNAYKIPAQWRPKTETEKALSDSLRDMELQCKERVDLFDALRRSRQEANSRSNESITSPNGHVPPPAYARSRQDPSSYQRPHDSPEPPHLGQGTIRPASYDSIARPLLPQRPSTQSTQTTQSSSSRPAPMSYPSTQSVASVASVTQGPRTQVDGLKVPGVEASRSPSPAGRSMLKSTLRPGKKEESRNPPAKLAQTMRARPPRSAAQAATLAWPNASQSGLVLGPRNESTTSLTDAPGMSSRGNSFEQARTPYIRPSGSGRRPPSPDDIATAQRYASANIPMRPKSHDPLPPRPSTTMTNHDRNDAPNKPPPPPPPHRTRQRPHPDSINSNTPSIQGLAAPPPPAAFPSYRKEYPAPAPIDLKKAQSISRNPPTQATLEKSQANTQRPTVPRKAVPKSPKSDRRRPDSLTDHSSGETESPRGRKPGAREEEILTAELPAEVMESKAAASSAWDARVKHLMKNLPKGVDEQAAKSIFNEVVIKGDEVHWDDVAGLDIAKTALKEAVVYPFLRPDLFLGLREPARGMLLFGPPGTGKTMLARAVATESQSTFFAISASSLTSKFLGESEKLVRALFQLAKCLTPSIIFVDEIDSLLSSRGGGGEHEATRRIKTEFLIQWSDLAKAAAGREQVDGDASRVLVLAATNLPWAIDEAARRRFVRRQYIPLPEDPVRESQLRRLVNAQKHDLNDQDFQKLVVLTDGFSGSDITALAKDAAMGPLRSLGEELLSMSPDQIRPIKFIDFEASLGNIRPSVSKQGLKEFEDWAKEFGERGG